MQRIRCELTGAAATPGPLVESKPTQEALIEKHGDEIDFVIEVVWQIGGSISNVTKELQQNSFTAAILTGRKRYHNGRWASGGPNPVQPTPEERRSLAQNFKAAAKKLGEIGWNVRCGGVDGDRRMLQAGIYLLIFSGGADQLDRGPGRCRTSRDRTGSRHVLRGKNAGGIVGCAWRRRSPKDELMSGKTGPLIGLEHVVGPSILGGELQIGGHHSARVIDISGLRLRKTLARALNTT